MASSRRTIDLDSLTFQTMYIRLSSIQQISSFYLPVIPGDSNVIKQFQYLTPQEALSVGGLFISPSTIPDLVNSINTISTNQGNTNTLISSVSSGIGFDIDGIQLAVSSYISIQQVTTYSPLYFSTLSTFDAAVDTNTSILGILSSISSLTTGLSSLSTSLQANFSSLGGVLDITFNQGPQVSTLSSYVFDYFRYLSESISSYSTSVGLGISTNLYYQNSTLQSYNTQIQTILATGAVTAVSSLSTLQTSSFISINQQLIGWDTGPGCSSISTFIPDQLSSLSTQFDVQLAAPGISAISTYFTEQYQNALSNSLIFSGVYELSSMSTTLYINTSTILSTNIGIGSDPRISSLSTQLGEEIKMISDIVCTIGFVNVILQQELVKNSLSSVSSSFGRDYSNLANLCTFSTLLPSAYSTISSVFSLQDPNATLNQLSTTQNSTLAGLTNYVSTSYPTIFTGPGVSSLSSMIPVYFSTFSSALAPVFSSFSNDIYNISSIRADPGLSSLSSVVAFSTISLNSTFTTIYTQYESLLVSTTEQILAISDLKGFDSNSYNSLNLQQVIPDLTSQFISTTNTLSTNLLYFVAITSGISSYLSTTLEATQSSFSSLQLTFLSTLSAITLNYEELSTLASTNLYNPLFSSFYADSITTSSLTIYNALVTSSIGIQISSSTSFPLSVRGSFYLEAPTLPQNAYVYVGASTNTSNTIWTASTYTTGLTSNLPNAFTGEGRDVAYNGDTWVAVGTSELDTNFIKYTTNLPSGWTNASIDFDLTSQSSFNAVKWSGSYWLAGGGPSTSIVSSYNGITWGKSDYGSTLTFVNDLAWNGTTWVAVGSNASQPYTSVYSQNGNTWQGGVDTFTGQGHGVATNGLVWVAVGENPSIQYSFNARNWYPVTNTTFSTAGYAVAWNGEKFVAVGKNINSSNILYSYTGQSWSYASSLNATSVFSTQGSQILWDGVHWLAAGLDTSNAIYAKQLSSEDGINWSSFGISTGILKGMAFASNTTPTIRMPNFDIFSGEIPVMMDSRKRMAVLHSSIYFNDGDLTIRRLTSTSTQGIGYVGINTTYPEYALDIGVGNARKPSGTTWVTASDQRVKTNIQDINLESCAKTLASIPLRQFEYTQQYRERTGVADGHYLGFIAQEVKETMPQCVRISNDFGILDFHSLDTDQLFKLEFGATQYLLKQVQELESVVSTLEVLRKKKD